MIKTWDDKGFWFWLAWIMIAVSWFWMVMYFLK